MSTRPNFSIITATNLAEIIRLSETERGHILVAQPGSNSHNRLVIDARLDFFSQPQINKDFLNIDLNTGRDKHRNYFLKPTPKTTHDSAWDAARDFFEKLKIDEYEFSINPQHVVSMGLIYERGVTLYIPPRKSRKNAIIFALNFMTAQFHYHFTIDNINTIVDYVMTDLVNGSVLDRNLQAGLDADSMVS